MADGVLGMLEREKEEAYWAYAISMEKEFKRLLDKGVITQGTVEIMQARLYATIHEKDPFELSLMPKCQAII